MGTITEQVSAIHENRSTTAYGGSGLAFMALALLSVGPMSVPTPIPETVPLLEHCGASSTNIAVDHGEHGLDQAIHEELASVYEQLWVNQESFDPDVASALVGDRSSMYL